MTRLLLIRHGQSENNALQEQLIAKYSTHTETPEGELEAKRNHDPKLSKMGLEQAYFTSAALSKQWAKKRCLVIASPMLRSLQTAKIIADNLAVNNYDFKCHGKLFEVGGCYYQNQVYPGATAKEIEKKYGATTIEFPDQGWFSKYTTKETVHQAQARIQTVTSWLQSLLQTANNPYHALIAVLHGELMHHCLHNWMGTAQPEKLGMIHANCGITEIDWHPHFGALLLGLNQLTHLPHELHTSTQPQDGWQNVFNLNIIIQRFEKICEITPTLYNAVIQAREQYLFPPENKKLEDYEESDARSIHFIAHHKNQLAGYIQYDPTINRLRQMIVLPDYRGQKIGLQLVDKVVIESQLHQHKELLVNAWFNSKTFYSKAGFEAFDLPFQSNGVMCQIMKKQIQKN